MSTDTKSSDPDCPFPCGWQGLHKIAVQDAAYLAKVQWPEDEEGVSVPRATAMRCMDYLIQVCRTMLNAAPVETPAPAFSVGVHGVGVIDDNPSALAVYFNAAPNDDDIRALHEIVSGPPVAVQAQQPVSGADGLATERFRINGTTYELPTPVLAELNRLYLKVIEAERDHLPDATKKVGQDQFRDAAQMIEPSGNSGELPDAARVPLDSLHADAVYLLSRVKQETLSIHDAALSIQHHIDSARAALAQQDAETGKSVSVENQGLTQQTSHHCDDACHEWRQERTPCPDGQCKVRNDAEAFKYWGGKETWVRYLTDHTGLIQITARDIATCNAALDAVKNALSPGAVQQDADKVKADLLSSLVEIVGAVIASDEEGLIEHSETIIKARAAIDAARKEQA